LATWERIKECKFLAAGKILWTSTFSNQFSEMGLLEPHRVIVPISTIAHKTRNPTLVPRDDCGKICLSFENEIVF
jgi:hypothetical protein